ncbi:MAG: YegP family protein [Devosia sp.]
MPHTFRIVARANDQFGVQFGYNAEVIVWSESYAGKASAKNCIESLKKNAPDAAVFDLAKEGEAPKGYRFEIVASKDSQAFVRFVAANGETMMRSETYKSKSSARHAIASIKKNAPLAETRDMTVSKD